ncbi:MotA/TolQ/ExbB proton channel family protein [Agriterribacter sp.]|uniref:MotA/TolQ/ExbB proton channel family protein n=1 Tax=Agriterribacter sp. TaxID=2821509 RepID=UPI002C8DE7F4|nr:MotA/TolQ/ExbB proton channel family protein [Agriterribacter sp.]HRO46916.1 MotA/TolQ/ExbB proton channel family protein [Agriterribacter sp.]HRQ17410.1 MotA/TolQ/ExbB proton channel family protein [Agriterribacter sp.]
MRLFFLQLAPDSLNKALASQHGIPEPGTQMNLWELLLAGGWIMLPLALLLVIAIFFFFERLIAIRNAGKLDYNFMSIIRDHIVTGNVTAARSLARNTFNPVARMIDKGLQRIGKPIEAIEKSMENVGKLEIYKMERNISVLSLIAGIAPMFGFLGTIIGMVQLFYGISSTGEYTLNTIAGGIYTKMITSASGLIIGLLAYVGYNYLNAQIDKNVNQMESASAEFIDVLQEPTK